GAEEALIMPTADDAKVLRDLLHDADSVFWDTEREVLIFGKIQSPRQQRHVQAGVLRGSDPYRAGMQRTVTDS
ncbi:MAG: hypothetical protein M3Q49_05930, partial [Actinomycetota bacterium]|nr:hypothetical protein [Actinomycetota bacterium]